MRLGGFPKGYCLNDHRATVPTEVLCLESVDKAIRCHVAIVCTIGVGSFLNCRLLDVRSRLYELLTHCIPPVIIMKVFTSAFV